MTVCIISPPDNAHAICVELALRKKDEKVVNWHWHDFPSISQLSLAVCGAGQVKTSILDGLPRERAVWVHRGQWPVAPPGLERAKGDPVMARSRRFLHGMLAELADGAFCVNPLAATHALQSKLNELSLAQQCGLTVPATLFSNEPAAIRAFFDRHHGEVVVKYNGQLKVSSAIDGSVRYTYTNRISAAQIAEDLPLSACPSIYQKEIDKAFELRIVFMGETVFAVKIDSQKKSKSLDWRKDFRGMPPSSVFAMPPAELAKIKTFIRASGLRYGSIDMIVDLHDHYVFLEVNETGQFLWVEKLLPELPLLDCFAQFLISRDPAFAYREGRKSIRLGDCDDEFSPDAMQLRLRGHVSAAEAAASIP